VLIVHGRIYAIQAGSTAAYLAHEGEIVALSADDVFEERRGSLLFRALGVAPALDVTISSAALAPGDAIILLGRRARDEGERSALLAQLEALDPGEHVLIARFEQDETAAADASGPRRSGERPWLARVAAAIASFFAAVRGR
jgi:hypothetical protein